MFWIFVNGGPVGFDPTTFRGPALVVISVAQYLLPLAVLGTVLSYKSSPAVAARVLMTLALAALIMALLVGIAGAGMML